MEVRLSILKMTCASWVTTPYRALLEVALQDVTSRKCVFAQMALIGPLARVSKKMPLQMFQVQISFVTVRTFVLAIGVLIGVGWCFSRGWSWPPRMGRQHASATLLAYDMYRFWFLIREHGRVRIELGMGCHAHAPNANVLQPIRQRRRSYLEYVGVGCRG